MPLLLEISTNLHEGAPSKERKLRRRFAQRNKTEGPVAMSGPDIKPIIIDIFVLLLEHLCEFLAVCSIHPEKQLSRPSNLLDEVTHAAGFGCNFGEV